MAQQMPTGSGESVDGAATALRVMVVDDHPIWREGVARDLAEDGFDVVATADGVRHCRAPGRRGLAQLGRRHPEASQCIVGGNASMAVELMVACLHGSKAYP